MSDVRTCDYCPRFARATIYLRQGMIRTLLRLRRRERYVCTDHLDRARRPAGRHA